MSLFVYHKSCFRALFQKSGFLIGTDGKPTSFIICDHLRPDIYSGLQFTLLSNFDNPKLVNSIVDYRISLVTHSSIGFSISNDVRFDEFILNDPAKVVIFERRCKRNKVNVDFFDLLIIGRSRIFHLLIIINILDILFIYFLIF
jgi:hypothetical protein